ncbi:hypothetical protein EHS25_001020 [Saitozyma podzolica]|uniref:Zn(2)-C6 fungal-type domain-containing protein n=1 Tax=Saitozyma podzolica TaxID=1890683 RepID=A0A427YGY1_9TREE|nr:hypothetical protein EHS25_001020 [Saitozyma podzolica]
MTSADKDYPAKRLKPSLACQTCRLRKQSCDGKRPCGRCLNDRRECVEGSIVLQSPLTRRRMNELEDRIALCSQIWYAIFPQLSLDAAASRAALGGVDVAVAEVLSLHAEALRSTSTAQTASDEWREEHSPQNPLAAPSMGGLDGMGTTTAMAKGAEPSASKGAGYFGLSSGATLLHAIRRLAPGEVFPSGLTVSESLNVVNVQAISGTSRLNPKTPASSTVFSIKNLPPPADVLPLVDSYFRYFHCLTPIVHEPTVRAQLMGALPFPTNNGARVLIYMIFAMGAFDMAMSENDDNGYRFYDKARQTFRQAVIEEGSLQLVQGLTIMAIYLQKSNMPNAGYVCLGLAIRMAIALGIHTSTTNDKLSCLDSEIRTRLWWSLVTLETGCSITFGRPPCLSLAVLNTSRLPRNSEDQNLTVSDIELPDDTGDVTLYTALIVQARLARSAFDLQTRISRSLPSPTVEQIKWCGDRFQDEIRSFPPHMRPGAQGPYRLSREIQSWRARDMWSVLYRPVMLSAEWTANGRLNPDPSVRYIVDTCRSLALDNLHDIAEFANANADPHRGSEWYILYFGFQASLALLISLVSEPRHPSANIWRDSIQQTVTLFRQLGSMHELATSHAQIMENVLTLTAPSAVEDLTPHPMPNQQSEAGAIVDVNGFDFERLWLEICGSEGTELVNETQNGVFSW